MAMTAPITPQIDITSRRRLRTPGLHDHLHTRGAHRLPHCFHLKEAISTVSNS